MAEPMPPQSNPEIHKPQSIIVGETPMYLATPQQIGGKDVSFITILGAEKRANDGVGSAIPLVKELSRKKGEEGKMVDKPLTNLNDFDEVPWEKVSGVQWTDEQGAPHQISKDTLTLTQPEVSATSPAKAEAIVSPEPMETPIEKPTETPSAEPAPAAPAEQPVSAEIQPPAAQPEQVEAMPEPEPSTPAKGAREILETMTEDPNSITIVGLKAYETRALDLADRSMQKLTNPQANERANASRTLWEKTKDAVHRIENFAVTTWKQSVGGIYFHEKARQYYIDMLKTAETPFAEDAIRLAERRATDKYNAKLADSNFLIRIGTKAVDWFKDKTGMRTTIQNLALEEIGSMRLTGEIKGLETFEREAKAIRMRFGSDMDRADQFVRKQLGEKLEILDPTKEEHKPLVEGIQSLLKQYASGEIPDKAEFDARTKEFFKATLNNTRPDIFAEAELYSSSLYEVAETLRMKMSHEGGLANIDEAISSMQIRLGLGQMGEVTSMDPTAVEKGVGQIREIADWLNKKNVLVPLVFNEATIGSGVAIALSAVNFLKTAPFKAVASITGPLGSLTGGALAGGLFAGWREYGQLQKDYMTHLRERESGAQFTEMQKRRGWFEKFAVKQRRADEMIASLQSALYEEGALKVTLTDDELRSAFATVADLHARKAVSETGPKRIGLIAFSNREAIESERSALDITSNKALSDLESYLTAHTEQAGVVLGGNTFPEFMEKLTVSQTQALREGANTLDALDDPIKLTLNLVSSYAPEAEIIRRRWPFASKNLSGEEKAMGLDAILEEFRAESRIEAVKYGVKAGVVGAAVGVAFQGLAQIGHGDTVTRSAAEFTSDTTPTGTSHIELSAPTGEHVVSVGNDVYQIPKEMLVTPYTENGTVFYDAKVDVNLLENLKGQQDVVLGTHLTEQQFKDTLEKAGMSFVDPHRAGEVVSSVHDVVTVPHLTTPSGEPITANLPEDYSLRYFAANHHWQLLDGQKHVVSTVEFTDTGEFKGTPDQLAKLTADLKANGLEWRAPEIIHATTPTVEPVSVIPTPEAPHIPGGTMMDIRGNELQEGGLWDYFLDKSSGENRVASANGVKNLFRLYEHHFVPQAADGTPENVSFGDNGSNPYDHVARLRDATFGDTPVKEFDIARIANDAHISVPKELFGPEAIHRFSEMNDIAIKHYQELVASGKNPMEVLALLEKGSDQDKIDALLLRMGYFGRDADLPSQAELAPLLEKLGLPIEGAPSPVIPPITSPEAPTEALHQVTITKVFQTDEPGQIFAATPLEIPYSVETVITKGTPAPELPWIPIFLPFREVLEAAPVEGLAANAAPGEKLLSPFGYEEAFLDREARAARKSPRLTENPQAQLNQREEIDWYLSQLTAEEQQTLEGLKAQENPALSPDTRAIISVPLVQNGSTIYQRLGTYAGQTNADGSPIDPKRTAFVVYETNVVPPTGSVTETLPGNTKAEIDRFRTDHPDTQVIYVTHTYPEQPSAGAIKRDMTNFELSLLSARTPEAPDVALVAENSTGSPIENTYLSSIIDTMDASPTVDMVSGAYQLPKDAYANYPMLFAHHRAFEIFDALVRHGEAKSVPAVFQGNLAVRAGTLAAVGGYNGASPLMEEREVAWMITDARGTPDVAVSLPSLTATMDPKETVYMQLQQLGLAEASVPLQNNEVYKNMSWEDMAKKAGEQCTKEHLEIHLDNMYTNMYPALKTTNPERFDAYFGRALDALGLTYELKDGKISLLDMTNLNANMVATPDIELFAKNASEEVVAALPAQPETPREHLETLAGEPAPEAVGTEVPSETVASSIASPEVAVAPQTEQPVVSEKPPVPERLPEGVEDRIKYVLNKAKESGAAVQLTTGELMDYVRSSVELPGARITGGKIVIQGNTVKLTDMKAKTIVGEAQFAGTLVTDPTHGLVVQKDTLQLHLPLLARPWEKSIHTSLDNFNNLVLTHLDGRINPAWKASRIDVTGDKLQVSFSKKSPAK